MRLVHCVLAAAGFVALAACGSANGDDAVSSDAEDVKGSPQSNVDLDVTYIRRTPEIPYEASPNVPKPGDAVQWIAQIRNRGTVATGAFDFRWKVDGVIVLEGRAESIPVSGASDVALPWTWQAGSHDVRFVVDPHNRIVERSKKNNARTVRSDALMVGFWVERSVRDWFDANRYAFSRAHALGDDANSWEDWAELQIDVWNAMLASAVYPSAPEGGIDRVRLQKVVVVDDGALPLHRGLPTNDPDLSDHTVDMEWGFPGPVDASFTKLYDLSDPKGHLVLEPSLLHEMSHARFLVDSYGLDVAGKQIAVTGEDGARLYDDDDGIAHAASTGPSLMRTTAPTYAEWEIDWLNAYAKERPLPGWGNVNESPSMSEYMRLRPAMPARNVMRFVTKSGAPAAGAKVWVYRATSASGLYGKMIDDVADVVGVADADGRFALGPQPFSAVFPNEDFDDRFWVGVEFIRVVHDGVEYREWLDLAEVNVAWFRGQKREAVYERKLEISLTGNWAPCTDDAQCASHVCGCTGDAKRVCLPRKAYAHGCR